MAGLKRWFLVACTAAVLGGCGGSSQMQTQDFMSQVRAYNESLRWQRFAAAATHIAALERDDFLDEREAIGEDLRIDGFEVKRVNYPKSGESALVRVEYEWHSDRRGVVYKTTTKQLWERHGQRWLMADETHVRGEQMPGVAQKVEHAQEAEMGAAFSAASSAKEAARSGDQK